MNRIPLAIRGFYLGEQDDYVEPWQLVSRLLTKSRAGCLGHGLSRLLRNRGNRTVLRKEAHIFDIAGGESFDIWEGGFEVSGDSGNDFRSPPLAALALQNVTPDAVVEANDLGIHSQSGATAGGLDAGFDLRKPDRIVGRDEFSGHGRKRGEFYTLKSLGSRLGLASGFWMVDSIRKSASIIQNFALCGELGSWLWLI
jgi:hypothetical protein